MRSLPRFTLAILWVSIAITKLSSLMELPLGALVALGVEITIAITLLGIRTRLLASLASLALSSIFVLATFNIPPMGADVSADCNCLGEIEIQTWQRRSIAFFLLALTSSTLADAGRHRSPAG